MIYEDNRTWFDKVKVSFAEKKAAAKIKLKQVFNWVIENPFSAIMLLSIFSGAVNVTTKGIKDISGIVEDRKEQRREDCRVWDPVNGIQWYTKKPLTNEQKLIFEERVKNGESRGEVLADMDVLRKARF